jgi:hypothetical protein
MKMGMILACLLMAGACASQIGIREEFEKSMKGYNRMLRWHEVENAGTTYVEPELQAAFQMAAEAIRRKGVTITDYRILTSECIPEKGTASVLAEFDYYILPSNRIKTLTYRQQWVYRELDHKKGWLLKSDLPQFE